MEIKNAITALSALAQETRLLAFRLLIQAGPEGLPAGKISKLLAIPPSSLSFHLKELAHAKMVTVQQEGRFVIYKANFENAQTLIGFLMENCCNGQTCYELNKTNEKDIL